MIESFKFYTPLLESPELFAQVRVGEFGTDINWSDDLDMAATTLWRLATRAFEQNKHQSLQQG